MKYWRGQALRLIFGGAFLFGLMYFGEGNKAVVLGGAFGMLYGVLVTSWWLNRRRKKNRSSS